MSQKVRNFRQKFHYRLRGTNAGKYRCAHTQKQVNLLFIYNFYLCIAYLNRPSVQHLSGNHNSTLAWPKGISFSGSCFYPLNSLALNFIWKQKCFVCPLSRANDTIPRGHILPVLSGRQHSATLQKECTLLWRMADISVRRYNIHFQCRLNSQLMFE